MMEMCNEVLSVSLCQYEDFNIGQIFEAVSVHNIVRSYFNILELQLLCFLNKKSDLLTPFFWDDEHF